MGMFTYGAVFIFGLVIGSFLNVVIYRMHTGKSVNGRSHCPSCGTKLVWYELVPVLSYVLLRGHCRTCRACIPMRYMLVELLAGGLAVLVWHTFWSDTALLALNAVLTALLVVVLVYDLRHMIVPDEAVIGLLLCAAGIVGYEAWTLSSGVYALEHTLAGVCAALFFAGLWYISGGRWLGLGDAKLALPLAAVVGVAGAPAFVVFSFWIGAAVSLLLLGLQQLMQLAREGRGTTRLSFLPTQLKMKSEIPFAPFLIMGFLYVHFFHVDLFDIVAWFTF